MISVRVQPKLRHRVMRGLVGALAAALPVMICLLLLPGYLTDHRAFTLLFAAAALGVMARLARRLPPPRGGVLRTSGALVAVPVLALVDTGVFCHLDAPFWVAAPLESFCAGPGAGTPACRLPGTQAAAGRPAPGGTFVHIVGHGWHTGLILETADLDPRVWPYATELRKHQHVELGWGDAQFYQADSPTLAMAVGAFVVPGPSVLHVAPFDGPIETFFPEGKLLRLPIPDFGALVQVVAETFHMGPDGRPLVTGNGDNGPESHFVQANGLYHFPETCNVWTARALAGGGLPLTPGLAITSKNLLHQAEQVGFVVR